MTMLAENVDAVIGGDTHRDTHALEMTAPNGTTLATLTITDDTAGFAETLAWIAHHAPSPESCWGSKALEATGSDSRGH